MENYTDTSDVSNASENIRGQSKIFTNLNVIPFGIPICLENILAIIVLMKSSRLIYQVRILSINLAITDCLAGFILSIPDDILGECLLKKYLTAPFIIVSLITITLINIDRCCSLKFALRYYEIVTPKVLKIACLLSWVVGVLMSYLMFFDPSYPFGIFCELIYKEPLNAVNYSTKVLQLLTIMSNLLMYIYMSVSLCTRSRSIMQPSIGTISKENENHDLPNAQPTRLSTRNPNTHTGQSFKNQAKVVKKMAMITGFFLSCYTPYFLFQIIPNKDDFYSNNLIRTLLAMSAGIMFLNSAINPILYVWRFTESRYQLKRMIYCWNVDKLRELECERNRFFATYQIDIISSECRSSPS